MTGTLTKRGQGPAGSQSREDRHTRTPRGRAEVGVPQLQAKDIKGEGPPPEARRGRKDAAQSPKGQGPAVISISDSQPRNLD
jgi:hypothetical protein